ncbi:MAG: L-threonylcarbamoyladenylate synthase [Candidatus Marinimicrobia bacterium]|nr:L-threonylcarbamoyladenylate synthase [Candidatus Neomarinimicrobiota bacterium]
MIIDCKNPNAIKEVLSSLKNEDIFIYPTDTLYGFGGDARSEKVVERLYELKQRSEHMPISMLVRDTEMLSGFAEIFDKTQKLINAFLPGALTLVLPAKDNSLPDKLFSVQGYLGFRIPDHDFCRNISSEFSGPIITTSVNLSGQPVLNDIESINDQFGKYIDLMISDRDFEMQNNVFASTVVMITENDTMKVLREGKISTEEITRILR